MESNGAHLDYLCQECMFYHRLNYLSNTSEGSEDHSRINLTETSTLKLAFSESIQLR
jgi:hypothetical protein